MDNPDQTKPSGHEASFALVMFLRKTYPDAFKVPPRPLKIGIHADIRSAHPDVPSRTLYDILHRWTSHPDYLEAIAAGTPRVGLNGEAHGEPDEDAVRIATGRLAELKRPRRKALPKAPAPRPPSIHGNPDLARAKSIRMAAEPDTPLSPEDRDFLVGLLRRHPDAGGKIGAGIAEIRVSGGKFILHRVDGTQDDFSVIKCLGETRPASIRTGA